MTQQQVQGQARQGASFTDMSDGGGVLTITGGKFEYNMYEGNNNVQAKLKMQSAGGKDFEWSLNVGSAEFWEPSADGLEAWPLRENGKISKSSGFGFFLQELLNAGFPENRLTNRLDSIFGVVFESHNLAPAGKTQDGSERKATMVPAVVINLPGDVRQVQTNGVGSAPVPNVAPPTVVPPTVAAPAPPTIPNTMAAPGGVANLADLGLNIVMELGNNFNLSDMMPKIAANHASDPPTRDALMGHVYREEFKGTLSGAGFTVGANGGVSK